MDQNITARFLRVTLKEDGSAAFSQALDEAFAPDTLKARRRNVGESDKPILVHIERLASANKEGTQLEGELVRTQRDNLPPEINDSAITPLAVAGLAHRSAFFYDKTLGVLLMESERSGVSHRRLGMYLQKVNPIAQFKFDPVPTEDAWKRFARGEPRRLITKVATVNDLSLAESETKSVAKAIRTMEQAFGGAYITIEVTMGHKKGSLVRGAVEKLIKGSKGKAGVDRLQVVMTDDDGGDRIDFLSEHLVLRTTLDLPSSDLDAHFDARTGYLRSQFALHSPYLKRLFGQEK